ncbi:MAG: DNA polymerase III subunit delta [Myxococcales bacterium]|nr:MAG: DNA polymerase III subunit delta [Myxococcales bacterium]
MHAADLIAQLSAGKPSSRVFVLVGTETVFQKRCLDGIKSWTHELGLRAEDIELHRGPSIPIAAVLESLRTPPMFASTRAIFIQQAETLKSNALDNLAEILKTPPTDAIVVLQAEKLDGRSRFAKLAKDKGYWIDLQPLKGPALKRFVIHQAKSLGHALSDHDASLLIDSCGSELVNIDDALQRLSLFVGPSQRIDAASIESCITQLPNATIWDLVDSVGASQTKQALRSLEQLLKEGEPPLRLLAMLARQFAFLDDFEVL